MIRLIEEKQNKDVVKPMSEMKPLEVCVIVGGVYMDSVVLRTASLDDFEVMDILHSGEDSCWTGRPNEKVRELREGETYTLELS